MLWKKTMDLCKQNEEVVRKSSQLRREKERQISSQQKRFGEKFNKNSKKQNVMSLSGAVIFQMEFAALFFYILCTIFFSPVWFGCLPFCIFYVLLHEKYRYVMLIPKEAKKIEKKTDARNIIRKVMLGQLPSSHTNSHCENV